MTKPVEKIIEEIKAETNPNKVVRSEEWKEAQRKREQTPQEKANHFKKGEARGRPKGIPNRSTRVLKESIALIVNNQIDKVDRNLTKLAKEDPAKHAEIIIKFAEFIQPKLSRTEVEGNVQHTTLIIGRPPDLKLPEPIEIKQIDAGSEE